MINTIATDTGLIAKYHQPLPVPEDACVVSPSAVAPPWCSGWRAAGREQQTLAGKERPWLFRKQPHTAS